MFLVRRFSIAAKIPWAPLHVASTSFVVCKQYKIIFVRYRVFDKWP